MNIHGTITLHSSKTNLETEITLFNFCSTDNITTRHKSHQDTTVVQTLASKTKMAATEYFKSNLLHNQLTGGRRGSLCTTLYTEWANGALQ
jgi:hypothetical protein